MLNMKTAFLLAISLLAVTAIFLMPPIAQDPAYHEFTDQRKLLGIPNFWNVFSNLAFPLVAIHGLSRASRLDPAVPQFNYRLICVAVLLVGAGSACYHWAPSNETLVWDRLPMTIAFMSLTAMMLGERVSERLGRVSLWPLLIAGAGSVFYWAWTEQLGVGDLRPYGLVQFLPMLLLPLLLLMYPQRYVRNGLAWAALAGYGLAKVAEHFDAGIYQALGWISGHALKHLIAALAIWWFILAIQERPAGQDPGAKARERDPGSS
jgi:hypothetical protein